MRPDGAGTAQIPCREIVDLLGEFLDRELGPARHARVARHLLDCPPCAAFFDRYRQAVEIARDAYRSSAPVELPEEFVAELVQRLRRAARSPEPPE